MGKTLIVSTKRPSLKEGWRWNGRSAALKDTAAMRGLTVFDEAEALVAATGGYKGLEALGIAMVAVPVGAGTYDLYVPVK